MKGGARTAPHPRLEVHLRDGILGAVGAAGFLVGADLYHRRLSRPGEYVEIAAAGFLAGLVGGAVGRGFESELLAQLAASVASGFLFATFGIAATRAPGPARSSRGSRLAGATAREA